MIANQPYLLRDQYRTDQNLQSRINLYQQFGQNPLIWPHWAFDHLLQCMGQGEASVLELGCGPGWLWRDNLDRIPQAWQITLSDFSPGMVAVAGQYLSGERANFEFSVFDAQTLPVEDGALDCVVANHMLYHVPDRTRTYREIGRVLRPGGTLIAATNGSTHMQEMGDLITRFDPEWAGPAYTLNGFTLEEAQEELAEWFPHVETYHYTNTLHVTEAGPLVDHVFSHPRLPADQREAFCYFVQCELNIHSSITLTPRLGVCVCTV